MERSSKLRINLHMLCQLMCNHSDSADRRWAKDEAKRRIAVEIGEVDQRSIIVSAERLKLVLDVSLHLPLALFLLI